MIIVIVIMGRNMIYGLETNNLSTYQRRRPLLNKILTNIHRYDLDIGLNTNEIHKKNDDELEIIYYNIILERIRIKINDYFKEKDRITRARDLCINEIQNRNIQGYASQEQMDNDLQELILELQNEEVFIPPL